MNLRRTNALALATGWLAVMAAMPADLGAQEKALPGLDSVPVWDGSRLAGTGTPPMPYRTEPAFTTLTFDQSADLDVYPVKGMKRLVVVELKGNVWSFVDSPGVKSRELLLDTSALSPPLPPGHGRQFYSLAFDPEFPARPFVYLSSNTKGPDKAINRVSRFTVTLADPPVAQPSSELALIEWETNGHNGCDLKFGADGMLYISTGDGEAPGDPANIGQTTDNLLGSILRIDVNQATQEEPYRIPEDNPFRGLDGVRPEVWAYGLRNPWKMNFRPGSNQLFVGDNGDEHWELVRLIERGTNHGWSAYEGSHPFRPANALAGPVKELTVPIVEHPHLEMRSVIGGLFYEGSRIPELANHYFYGCYFTRKIWGFEWKDGKALNPQRLADTGLQIVGFGQDTAGEPLVVTLEGTLLKLSPQSDETQTPRAPPSRLSETGLFTSTADLSPAPGMIPYDINASAWFDGARKIRFFAPGPSVAAEDGEKVQVRIGERQHKSWRFPNGSAFSQTFVLPDAESPGGERRVETQVMHQDGGEWQFLTYRWNAEQTDAELVPLDGAEEKIAVTDPDGGRQETHDWRFLSRAECSACHTQRTFFLLGFSTGQMSREFDYSPYGGHPANQLDTLAHLGLFPPRQLPNPHEEPPLVDPYDESAPLDERARVYLHVNCAHCHRETGLGGRAAFQLLHYLPLEETGCVNTAPLVGLSGNPEAKIIRPGAPDDSELLIRMTRLEAGRMPLIGSRKPDKAGIRLIGEWIRSLPDPDPAK